MYSVPELGIRTISVGPLNRLLALPLVPANTILHESHETTHHQTIYN